MNYRFYTVSSDAWDAMLATMKKAKHSIYWESYILRDDTPAYDFFEVLVKKAKQGVKVKVIVDAIGSFFLSSKAKQELVEAGAEVLVFNRLIPWWNPYHFKRRWFNRNHKKVLIVDEEIGFIGGVNVAKAYANWFDLHVKLQGVIVRYLIRSFAASYKLSGGKEEIKYKSVFRETKVRVFYHSPLTKKGMLSRYYKQSCLAARKSIIIATPYFVPQPWLIRCLQRSLKRGVRVDLILPKKTDYLITDLANYTFASLLYRPGINLFFTKSMLHAKAFLVDDREGMIGSQNIDSFSFDYNLESGIVFQRKDMIENLQKILKEWKQDSEKLVFDHKNRKWYQRLKDAIFIALRPLL